MPQLFDSGSGEVTAEIQGAKPKGADVISAAAALAGVPTGEAMARGGLPKTRIGRPVRPSPQCHEAPENGRESGQNYIKAAPGEATRVFMATAGIFERRRKNKIAAIASVIFCLVAGTITLDLMGYIEIQGWDLSTALLQSRIQTSTVPSNALKKNSSRPT